MVGGLWTTAPRPRPRPAHASDGRDRSCLIHSDAAEDAVVSHAVRCFSLHYEGEKHIQILLHGGQIFYKLYLSWITGCHNLQSLSQNMAVTKSVISSIPVQVFTKPRYLKGRPPCISKGHKIKRSHCGTKPSYSKARACYVRRYAQGQTLGFKRTFPK